MKKTYILLVFSILTWIHVNAQPVGRITFSSGGSSLSNQLPVSVGEVFVGAYNNLTMGSQQVINAVGDVKEPLVVIEALLYPNPTNGLLNIELSKFPSNQISIVIFSSSGQQVLSQKFEQLSFEVNIRTISAGSYFLVFYNTQGIPLKTISFIKQ